MPLLLTPLLQAVTDTASKSLDAKKAVEQSLSLVPSRLHERDVVVGMRKKLLKALVSE